MTGIKAKIFGVIGIATAIAFALLFAWGVSWKSTARDFERAADRWQAKHAELSRVAGKVLVSIRLASDNPDLGLNDAAEQVDLISESRRNWIETSHLQTRRIDDQGMESARLKALNATLRKRAEAAIAKRDSVINRLEHEALTPGERADCAKALSEAVAALDLAYSEGL